MNGPTGVQRRLAEMAGLELGWRVVAGEWLAWMVTSLALVMSYHAEQDLGQSLDAFRGWPALVWPLSVDVADVGLMVLYLEYKRLGLSTWKVWLGMVAATTVMIAANVRSAWPDPTARWRCRLGYRESRSGCGTPWRPGAGRAVRRSTWRGLDAADR